MWPMVRRVCLPVHTNNYAEETTEFWHETILLFNCERRKELAASGYLLSASAIGS
jgi:hypothetical protein